MNVTMHPPVYKVADATSVIEHTDAGVVSEVHLHPEGGFLVFRDVSDYDWLISVLVAARAGHGHAQARHEASNAAAPDPVTEMRAAAFTELVAQALVDPDCAAGKHPSCIGGPCTCSCHSEPGLRSMEIARRLATGLEDEPISLAIAREAAAEPCQTCSHHRADHGADGCGLCNCLRPYGNTPSDAVPELPQRAEPHPCPPCQFGNHDDCYATDGKPCTCHAGNHAEWDYAEAEDTP